MKAASISPSSSLQQNALVSSGMQTAGYKSINIDAGWWSGSRDGSGNITVNLSQWPGGMQTIANYIHSKGLKAGIYTDAGINGCVGNNQGSYNHYAQDMLQFERWGFDYVKVDWCGGNSQGLNPAIQYGQVRDAIASATAQTGHSMVFSICDWGVSSPWAWGPSTGNLWRTTSDITCYSSSCNQWNNVMSNLGSNRLPSRSMLLDIADYLECSLSQRNDLLLAAQYLPEQPEWEGNELRRALEHAQQIMETLPYPAIVVTHTFQIQAANEFFLRLLELPPLDTFPQHQRSTIHFLFHPDSLIRTRSTINAEARATWQKHALYGIQLFKQQNMLYQYDAWYQQFVKQCCDIADFQEYWEKAREATRLEDAPPKMFLARMATTGELLPIRVQHMLVSVSSKIYPAVSALLPVDEAARAVYASLGSVTSWSSSVG